MEDKIKVLLSEDVVDLRIKRDRGQEITKDYQGKRIHLICVLKGGVFLPANWQNVLTCRYLFDFMSVSSYGAGTVSSGIVKIVKDLGRSHRGYRTSF